MEPIDPETERLRAKILQAFATVGRDQTLSNLTLRLADLKNKHRFNLLHPFRLGIEFSEEADWLGALIENQLCDDLILRVPISAIKPETAIGLLPLLMTVPTNERWKLGRGVSDCGLYVSSSFQNGLVKAVESQCSNEQIEAIVSYVSFCRDHFEDGAIVAWDEYWSDRSKQIR